MSYNQLNDFRKNKIIPMRIQKIFIFFFLISNQNKTTSYKAFSFLGISEEKHAATKFQYNLTLFIILTWFIIIILADFVPRINEISFVRTYHFWIILGSDILFLIAVFVIGGNQMITKIGKLFTWEPWELPSNNK